MSTVVTTKRRSAAPKPTSGKATSPRAQAEAMLTSIIGVLDTVPKMNTEGDPSNYCGRLAWCAADRLRNYSFAGGAGIVLVHDAEAMTDGAIRVEDALPTQQTALKAALTQLQELAVLIDENFLDGADQASVPPQAVTELAKVVAEADQAVGQRVDADLAFVDFATERLLSARGVLWMLIRNFGGEIPEDERASFPMQCLSIQYVARMLEDVADWEGIPESLRTPAPGCVQFFSAVSEGQGIAHTLDAMLFADGWQQQAGSDEMMSDVIGAIDNCVSDAYAALLAGRKAVAA